MDQGTAFLEAAEQHHQKIKRHAQGSAADALAAGRALIAAKAATPKKGWLVALKGATSMTPRSVQRYMLLARAMDAGLLGEALENVSFSHAYRVAVRQALRIARKSTAASQGGRAGPDARSERNNALKAFRQAARAAMSAGVTFKRLEFELAERVGVQVLRDPSAAGATAEVEE